AVKNATGQQQQRRARRLSGVFVMYVRRRMYKGPRLRYWQYFPSTLAASRYMGYKSDAVANSIHRGNACDFSGNPLDPGTAQVRGVYFRTANALYSIWRALRGSYAGEQLAKHMPFLFDGTFQFRPPAPKRTWLPLPRVPAGVDFCI